MTEQTVSKLGKKMSSPEPVQLERDEGVYVSIVIPVYNEEDCLESLYQRLTTVMDSLNKPYEILFTNDGSKDRTSEIYGIYITDDPNRFG